MTTGSEREDKGSAQSGVTRRAFLKGAGLSAAAAAGIAAGTGVLDSALAATPPLQVVGPGRRPITLNVNGSERRLEVEPSATLLDVVRGQLDLIGAKRVCDRGSCGACTMLVDGRPINSCTYLAIDAEGKRVTTVEGLAAPGAPLTRLQQAFIECDALQCGFCTPGMVMACTALLARNPSPARPEIAAAIAGNLCRCGTYQNIFEAVELAARRGAGGGR
ncbi:MAG: (2Fe-2S)-binding protein [Planctomycetes bacterium]|nr:(2Fe-2S)-binding protein [Planctomycetota bacterium]